MLLMEVEVSLKSFLYVVAVPVALAAPAIGLYTYGEVDFGFAGSGSSEPSKKAEPVAIIVNVDWGDAYSGRVTKSGLQDAITLNLEFRTDEYAFQFNDVPGKQVGITFTVSHNVYGPFPPNAWLDGMVTSLIALQAVETSRERWGSS